MTGDAVGFLVDVGGVRFWDVADSEYDARLLPMREEGIDVMLLPINGVGGNMNAHEAALLVWQVAPRIAVPMHYGMWPEEQYGPGATLDPATFRDTLARLGGETRCRCWSLARSHSSGAPEHPPPGLTPYRPLATRGRAVRAIVLARGPHPDHDGKRAKETS